MEKITVCWWDCLHMPRSLEASCYACNARLNWKMSFNGFNCAHVMAFYVDLAKRDAYNLMIGAECC